MKTKIYSGLSLDSEFIAKAFPDALASGPIKRGDLLKDIHHGIQVIGIIDGEFMQNQAVSPSEILDCLRCGLRIYGSSSMGALRAVELSQYGMIGHGRIYENIRSKLYFKDDHLGQTFFESELGEISPSMIDLEMAILDLVQNGKLSKKNGKWIIQTYGNLHFSERSILELKRIAANSRDHRKVSSKTIQEIVSKIKRTKKMDAIGLLKRMKADLREIKKLNTFLSKNG